MLVGLFAATPPSFVALPQKESPGTLIHSRGQFLFQYRRRGGRRGVTDTVADVTTVSPSSSP